LVSCFQMLCPSWLLAAAVLCFHSPYVEGRCLDLIDCMGLKTNEQKLVRFILTQESSNYGRVSASEQQNSEEEVEEVSLSLGLLLSALSPDSTERSYSMQHFRWGKPMGRKRRPIKVITSSALEEEPEESAESVRMERGQNGILDVQQRKNAKSNGKYRMTHFRWNTPPTSSLLTLIRNIIVKDAQQFRD
uniref:Proopiomelanocortin b n=1 Tax=Cyprinus carpio TaxID=7962 RepID=A0A8C1KEA3_CYPCA